MSVAPKRSRRSRLRAVAIAVAALTATGVIGLVALGGKPTPGAETTTTVPSPPQPVPQRLPFGSLTEAP
ncbi:hypothetical protein MKOR_38240 [Mycolicibacillus koreensis]|nr:hypothetical protein MKOR_38240 [Mycolicibacillus koreensis]